MLSGDYQFVVHQNCNKLQGNGMQVATISKKFRRSVPSKKKCTLALFVDSIFHFSQTELFKLL